MLLTHGLECGTVASEAVNPPNTDKWILTVSDSCFGIAYLDSAFGTIDRTIVTQITYQIEVDGYEDTVDIAENTT